MKSHIGTPLILSLLLHCLCSLYNVIFVLNESPEVTIFTSLPSPIPLKAAGQRPGQVPMAAARHRDGWRSRGPHESPGESERRERQPAHLSLGGGQGGSA